VLSAIGVALSSIGVVLSVAADVAFTSLTAGLSSFLVQPTIRLNNRVTARSTINPFFFHSFIVLTSIDYEYEN
jgi:hypothetical protein